MAVSSPAGSHDGLLIDPADRETFSLYAQFADMAIDLPSSSADDTANQDAASTRDSTLMPDPLFSSPRSEVDPPGSVDSKASRSTARTTPLRNELFGRPESPLEEHPTYMRLLRRCDLPTQTTTYLAGLGYQILNIGQLICSNPPATIEEANISEIISCSSTLLNQLHESADNCKQQSETLKWLKTLAAFNVVPSDWDLWSNYRQRSSLIIQHAAKPSKTELTIFRSLTHVFDAYIHHPFILLARRCEIDAEVAQYVAKLYHAVMTLSEVYYTWCRGMKDLKDVYMEPLMARMLNSAVAKQEMKNWNEAKDAARRVLSDPGAPGLVKTVDPKVVETLKKTAAKRTAFLSSKLKSRYRRIATV